MISKLLVTHKNGDHEAEENASDSLAMHVYPNSEKGTKVLSDENALIRSPYGGGQTRMLYLRIKRNEYFSVKKVLNLVLD